MSDPPAHSRVCSDTLSAELPRPPTSFSHDTLHSKPTCPAQQQPWRYQQGHGGGAGRDLEQAQGQVGTAHGSHSVRQPSVPHPPLPSADHSTCSPDSRNLQAPAYGKARALHDLQLAPGRPVPAPLCPLGTLGTPAPSAPWAPAPRPLPPEHPGHPHGPAPHPLHPGHPQAPAPSPPHLSNLDSTSKSSTFNTRSTLFSAPRLDRVAVYTLSCGMGAVSAALQALPAPRPSRPRPAVHLQLGPPREVGLDAVCGAGARAGVDDTVHDPAGVQHVDHEHAHHQGGEGAAAAPHGAARPPRSGPSRPPAPPPPATRHGRASGPAPAGSRVAATAHARRVARGRHPLAPRSRVGDGGLCGPRGALGAPVPPLAASALATPVTLRGPRGCRLVGDEALGQCLVLTAQPWWSPPTSSWSASTACGQRYSWWEGVSAAPGHPQPPGWAALSLSLAAGETHSSE